MTKQMEITNQVRMTNQMIEKDEKRVSIGSVDTSQYFIRID